MLFDLRGRGRRRVVQVVYLSLAVLMGGGLILFGIGGNTSGGLFDAFTGGNSMSGTDIYRERIESANKVLATRPDDPGALLAVTRARYQEAQQAGYDSTTGQYTDAGLRQLNGADRAWQRYLATDPQRLDDSVAALMSQVYAPTALNSPTRALQAWQVVTDVREPEAGLFVELARLGYLAKRTRVAELARSRALELTPAAERKALRTTLDGYKTQAATAAAGAAGATSATPQPTLTTG